MFLAVNVIMEGESCQALYLLPLHPPLGALPARQPVIQCRQSGGLHCPEWGGSDVEPHSCGQRLSEWKPPGHY